jgi:hypothetical protein
VAQLRLVFAELHAVSVRDPLRFANVWRQFDAAAELREPDCAVKSVATMLAQSNRCTGALREPCKATPYGQMGVSQVAGGHCGSPAANAIAAAAITLPKKPVQLTVPLKKD